jgi:hypothetical protein
VLQQTGVHETSQLRTRIKGAPVKEFLQVTQALDLELLGTALYHFTVEGFEQAIG